MPPKNVYTSGSIGRTMLYTALAMLPGTLSISGYNIADTYFVGKLPGASPLAAMGYSFPVIMLLGCVFHGLAIGVMTNAAHSLGGNRHRRAAGIVGSGLALITLVSLLLSAAGIATVDVLFGRFGATGQTLGEVQKYMNTWYFGCFGAALSMTTNSLLIATGDSRMASVSMIGGMLVNVGLDPWFIFGGAGLPAMGISGAALATIISQFSVMVFNLALLHERHKLFNFEFIPRRKLFAAWRLTIRFAIPATLGMLVMPIGSFLLTGITGKFGDAAVAAVAASGRLEMVAFVFPMAIGMTLVPMVGQNFGARLYSRIRACQKFAMGFALIYLSLAGVFYVIFANSLVKIFASAQDVREIMVTAMRIIPWGFAGIEVHRFSGFFFTGCGRPSAAAWLNFLRIGVLMVPFSFLALHLNSLPGLFWARLSADLLAGGIGATATYFMLQRLPADGEPAPAHNLAFGVPRLLYQKFLHLFAFAQSDIDGKSTTQ